MAGRARRGMTAERRIALTYGQCVHRGLRDRPFAAIRLAKRRKPTASRYSFRVRQLSRALGVGLPR